MGDSNNNLDNESKNNNKKKIIFMIIGLVIMLILVIGSTYAYFSVDVNNSTSKTTITGVTEKVGIANIKGLIGELHLNLSASDMSEANKGEYYATEGEEPHVKTKEEGTKKISQVEIKEGPNELKYSCSVDVEITNTTADNSNDMLEVLEPADMFIGIEGKETDLKDFLTENPTTNIKFKITGNGTKDIELYVRLVNKETVQDYLAGKELGLEIKTQNLKCEIDTSKGMTGLELAESNPAGLKKINTGDLAYRYVGKQTDIVDNYVCFGAPSCTGKTDNHLYRIIGITAKGNLKIQKNSSITPSQWHDKYRESDCSNGECTWEKSTMYTNTLKSTFYGSETYVSQAMKNKIDEEHTWNTGDVNGTSASQIGTGDTVYNLEYNDGKSLFTGEIGLAYLSDYYFAYDEQGTQNCYNDPYCKSWMIPNDTNSYSSQLLSGESYERTMTRYGRLNNSYYGAWLVTLDGYADTRNLNTTYAVRPVFYLIPEATISGGEGSLESPYIIN